MTRYVVTIADVNDASIRMVVVEAPRVEEAVFLHPWMAEPYRPEYLAKLFSDCETPEELYQQIYNCFGWITLCVDWNTVTMNALNGGDSSVYFNQLQK